MRMRVSDFHTFLELLNAFKSYFELQRIGEGCGIVKDSYINYINLWHFRRDNCGWIKDDYNQKEFLVEKLFAATNNSLSVFPIDKDELIL